MQSVTESQTANDCQKKKSWNMINPILKVIQTGQCAACYPCTCGQCHACSAAIHSQGCAEGFAGGNSHYKGTVRREGVWVVIQHTKLSSLGDYTGAHEQSGSDLRRTASNPNPSFKHDPLCATITQFDE